MPVLLSWSMLKVPLFFPPTSVTGQPQMSHEVVSSNRLRTRGSWSSDKPSARQRRRCFCFLKASGCDFSHALVAFFRSSFGSFCWRSLTNADSQARHDERGFMSFLPLVGMRLLKAWSGNTFLQVTHCFVSLVINPRQPLQRSALASFSSPQRGQGVVGTFMSIYSFGRPLGFGPECIGKMMGGA